jgi:hypothetical protein
MNVSAERSKLTLGLDEMIDSSLDSMLATFEMSSSPASRITGAPDASNDVPNAALARSLSNPAI